MSAINFNLRGIEPKIMAILKQEASKQNTSVNGLILNLIKKGIGYSTTMPKPTYYDLDHLAGTWKKEDAKEFEKATKFFEKIDKDLWE